ncbi:MAG: response regulator [FCB group bacterium]|jgi:DNA-binding response OmpR family regulator|nr:response regulator [FCB group bacterium]
MIRDLKILLVDDDPEILELLSTFLSAKGFDVMACGSGEAGLELLQHKSFDLILSDIEMAGMNGFEFLRQVRSAHDGIGIILMTAYDEQYPMSEALRAGADGYITKPFELKKFSLIFEEAYWSALSRQDWWLAHASGE